MINAIDFGFTIGNQAGENERGAGALEQDDGGGEMLGDEALEAELATGDDPGDQESAGLNAVGDNGMLDAVKIFYAFNFNAASALPCHFGAHFNEQLGQVADFRL